MKFIKDNITTILIIVVAVLVTILVVGMFRRNPVDNSYKDKIAAQEQIIAAKQQVIDAMDKSNERLDATIASYGQRDSALLAALSNNKVKYIANDKKLIDVHTTVANLDKEQLRAEIGHVVPNN